MLGKLLAYDLRALSRILIPVHLAAIALGLIGSAAGFIGFSSYEFRDAIGGSSSSIATAITGMAGLMLLLCIVALFSCCIATFVIVLVRFYQNLFTDEGYLTLTLPVTAVQQLTSKLLAGIIWMVIDGVVMLICSSAMTFAGFGFSELHELSDWMPLWMLSVASGDVQTLIEGAVTPALIMVWALRCVLLAASTLLIAYAALTLGASVAARHKVVAGIAFFVGINWAISLIGGTMNILALVALSWDSASMLSLASGLQLFLQIAAGTGGWFLCVYYLKNKINLA